MGRNIRENMNLEVRWYCCIGLPMLLIVEVEATDGSTELFDCGLIKIMSSQWWSSTDMYVIPLT